MASPLGLEQGPVGDRLVGAEGMEGGDVAAAESGTLEVHGQLMGRRGRRLRGRGVESVDPILDAAQARFFARAVADQATIGLMDVGHKVPGQ